MKHPYQDRPATAFWRSAVAEAPQGLVDPVTRLPFAIAPGDAIATAGSCFAQHLARHLQARGLPVMRCEAPPEAAAGDREGYALFSANYGNIYTTRHLLRLFEEAYGLHEPRGLAWQRPDGAFIDALRPRIEAAGFADASGVHRARAAHLDAVRRVFEECDVFVFTLGLVEAWIDTRDGTAWPVAPGIVAMPPEPDSIAFHDFSLDEVRADLFAFLDGLRDINPSVRCLLTVSPVPLAATATDAHVLAASTHGKAVLRVVAEEAARRFPWVGYFPAYEIVTVPQSRFRPFAPDMRTVTPEAVAAVMTLFDRHLLAGPGTPPGAAPPAAAPPGAANVVPTAEAEQAHAALLNVVCDEDAADPGLAGS